MCLFGRPIKDFIPILPDWYEPHSTWVDTLNKREDALRNHQNDGYNIPSSYHHLRVQNQTGPYPLKWDKTGRIVEIWQFDPYVVGIDESGHTSLRNRKFLQKFLPIQKPKEKRSVVEHFKFFSTINRPIPSVPATIPSESVVGKPSTERDHPPQQRTPTSQTLVPPSSTTDVSTPLLLAWLGRGIFHQRPWSIFNWNHRPQRRPPK